MGKTIKKVLGLALASLMVMTVLAGCGTKDKDAKIPSDWDEISAKGEMTIGITYFAPMNFKDKDGNLTGFETEFATAVSEKLGVKPNFIEIEWSAKETELSSKNIDCIWNGMTIDEQKKVNMAISTPYMANKQVMVVKKGNEGKYNTPEGIKGATVVAEKGSAGETVAQEEEFFKEANYTAVDSQAKVLLEIKSGTADVGVIDYVMTIGSIGENTDYADLVMIPEQTFADEEYGIAFRKGSDSAAKVNEVIQQLANEGKLEEIAKKYKLQDQLLVKPQN